MTPLPPAVVGPLSECSSSVRVQGQLIGATVDVYSNGTHVASGAATWPDQSFPLFSGKTLAAGASVTATQTQSGVTSPQSPSPVTVQKKPATIGFVTSKTHIYVCGQCLWLDGMVPGAKVEVSVGGVLRGSGIADDGSARIGLSPATQSGDTLVAQQIACGIPGPQTNLPNPDILPGDKRQLPSPTVEGPLRACQRFVTVKDVVEGAQVVLTEAPKTGFTETACFDLSDLKFPTPPLTLGDTVTAIQQMPGCEIKSGQSAAVPVGPSTPVPVPTVVPPLCAGGVSVGATNLLPGSPVEIFQNGASLGQGSAPATTFAFPVPALAANATITARQELCTNWSAPSAGVPVDPQPASLPTPLVASPLFECGAAVHVSNLHPGAIVYAFSTLLGAPINNPLPVYTTQADIPVAPLLITGDQIYAEQQGCGLRSSQSAAVTVQTLPTPGIPVVLPPVESCMRSVTVGNVVAGAHVDVYVNAGWRGTAIATAATVEVPILFGPLNVGDEVAARQMICNVIGGPGEPVQVVSSAGFYYVTQHFDVARTGWNPFETILTVGNVGGLKQQFTQSIDGTVYAQPLYAHHVNVPAFGAHNLVFVATENDTVYAFDADTNQPALWQRSLIPAGEQVVPWSDTQAADGSSNVWPVIGITGTPVIDCATYTMWVVAYTKRVAGGSTTYHYRLYALNIGTGADQVPPVEIAGSVPGTSRPNDGHGHVVFDPHWHLQRPALLLFNGVVYVGFGSHGDAHISPPDSRYHGWVFAFDAATLAQMGIFATTPDTPSAARSAAGIWQSGMGLAADPQGSIYFTTGNGDFTANLIGGKDYGDTVVKLTALAVADYFTPSDQPILLAFDIDLGSGGVLILPDPPPTTGFPDVLVAAGKDGNILLINRNNMGKYTPGGPDKLVQFPPLQMRPGARITDQSGVWGGPAYYRSPNQQQLIYYAGNGGNLKAYTFSGNALTLSNQSSTTFGNNGTTPNVSSNQQTVGTGVVWALVRAGAPNPLHLQAFDAANLTHQLLDVECGPWTNQKGGAFIEPTTIRGKVYVAGGGQLTVFGL